MTANREPAEFLSAASPRRVTVGAFADELSQVLGVQLSASRRDVAQAQTILNDAVERLMQCLPRMQLGARGAASEGMASLSQALINMQFQDLVSQLLRRADDRLAAIDALLLDLARILSVEDANALRTATERLGAQTLAPERRTSNSIQQMDMAPGDVELF